MSTDNQDSPRLLGEISQGPSAFEQFLDRNQKNMIVLSITVAVATAAYLVYQGVASSKEHTAGAALCKATDLPALQDVIKSYSGTAAAGTATLPLAERQWIEAQQDAAIATLKSFIAANPKHPARPGAQASLAGKLKTQGKLPEAIQLFQELADDPAATYLAPYALVSLGDLAKTSGETEQAEKFYQKAKSGFPGSSFGTTIDQRLALLKAKLPVEIDPPPAPPVTPGAPPATPGAAPIIPSIPPTVPGSPPVIPGAGQPLIPGLPPSGQDSSETDVPPVNNPFIKDPKPTPAENPTPEAPPAPPAGTPAAPTTPAPPTTPAAPPAPPAPEAKPPATPETPAGTPAPPTPPAPDPAPPAVNPPAAPEAPPAPAADPAPPAEAKPAEEPPAAPRSEPGTPAPPSQP